MLLSPLRKFRAIPHRGCKSLLYCPSVLQSLVQGVAVYSQLACPISQTESTPIKGQPSVTSHVSFLCLWENPRTVRGRIAFVVIDPFNSMMRRWSGSHVSEKALERLTPVFADNNPSPSVVSIAFVLRVMASLDHCIPSAVFRGLEANTVVAVFGDTSQQVLPSETPTASLSSENLVRSDYKWLPAITDTMPIGRGVPFLCSQVASKRRDSQTTESLSGQVSRLGFKSWLTCGKFFLRHAAPPSQVSMFRGPRLHPRRSRYPTTVLSHLQQEAPA